MQRLGRATATAVAVCIVLAAIAGCQKIKDDDFYVQNLLPLEDKPKAPVPADGSSARIEELKREIARYRDVVDKKVQASEQLGIYHKMLAVAYMRREMYQAAYQSLMEALGYHPANSVLYYYAGVCAAQTSKAASQADRGAWLDRAESHYRRALDLDADYVEAMYGLAVLYTFELNKLPDAERLTRRILQLRARYDEASFLLGNILYRMGRLPESAGVYKQIAETTQVEAIRNEAIANKSRIDKEISGLR
jgi:tetratricopeptide (TPR) repeat protein